jgi:hypothetical protein
LKFKKAEIDKNQNESLHKRFEFAEFTLQNLHRQLKYLHDPFPALEELLNRKCDECTILNKKIEVLENEIKIIKLRCSCELKSECAQSGSNKELMMLMGEQIARTMSLNAGIEEQYGKKKHDMAAKINGFLRQFDLIDLEVKGLRSQNAAFQSEAQSLRGELSKVVEEKRQDELRMKMREVDTEEWRTRVENVKSEFEEKLTVRLSEIEALKRGNFEFKFEIG